MLPTWPAGSARFNEAAGFIRRKPDTDLCGMRISMPGFNEAAGFIRRKLGKGGWKQSRQQHNRFNEAAGFIRRKLTNGPTLCYLRARVLQ